MQMEAFDTPAVGPPATATPAGHATRSAASCVDCHMRGLCLPAGLEGDEIARLDAVILTRRRLRAQQRLCREGDRFLCFYAVRSGTLRSSIRLRTGQDHVTGFHITGELMGLDGLADGRCATTITALEDSEVCMIPYAELDHLMMAAPRLRHAIYSAMSREIVAEHDLTAVMGSMQAEERVAAFLLNLSQRYARRGYSAREFNLRMTRAEIGSYLGLKLETISRALSVFQQQRLLEVDRRHILIRDIEGLMRAVEHGVH